MGLPLAGSWSPLGLHRAHALMEIDESNVQSDFADRTKLRGTVNSLKSREVLQRDLNRRRSWGAMTSCMTFNKGKCHILHLGHDSPDYL